jgi:glycosyltransferase involved in cell wall biosynthesis
MGKSFCVFSAQYLPHMGGVERYTYNLAKKLVEMGNTVTVVTSNTEISPDEEEMEGIKVYRFPCFNLLDGRYPVLKINYRFKELQKKLQKNKYDLVIVNTRFYVHSIYGQWLAKKMKSKVITIDHGSSHLSVGNPLLDFMGGIFEHFMTKIGQLYCKDYYGVSGACVEWLKHFHIKAKGILYNSVDVECIEKILLENKKKFREQYGIDQNAMVITFTGRLLPEKGVPQLINAFEQVQKEIGNAYLFIAGDGALEGFVKEQKNSHIIYLGKKSFEDVMILLSETDIFCLPSFSEGFSTSILEAIVCKCYVITTERGGAKETFPTEEYGMVIQNNNSSILTEAMINAITNPADRKNAVELSYKRLINNFTWDIVSVKVNDL